ncbi:MAG TPA: hypothetical protein VK014_00945 [Cyclobacteriaceae bacterium]|nr:hypothetical protein [Cyclobacteriaceae bacterium]
MNITDFENLLSGGDLRSIGHSNEVVLKIGSQEEFDRLIALLFHENRLVAMRAADIVEKVTIDHPLWLNKHKGAILQLCQRVQHKELQWHLAQLLPRLTLNQQELLQVWELLLSWTKNKKQSRIVRVFSLQSLYDLLPVLPDQKQNFSKLITELQEEQIPSLNARIKKLSKMLK